MKEIVQEPGAAAPAGQVERERLRQMSTPALVKQAISEAKLLAEAELVHARLEFEEELLRAKTAGILLGCCAALLLCCASVAFVGIALALPISETAAAFVVSGCLLAIAALCGAIGYRRLPRKPLQKTKLRIKEDLATVRERLA